MTSNLQVLMVLCVVMVATLDARVMPPHQKKSSHTDETQYYVPLKPQIQPKVSIERPINNDSISPWSYTYSSDENRVPKELPKARCNLTGCLNYRGEEVQELESRLIYIQIMVLRRVRSDENNYFFRLEYERIPVGCTCVRPYVQQV